MLISLTMKKWRKHEDKTVNFTKGLNAVRGANENGKTSMLWAIAYALWGAKALPLPMDEMVTWGHPTKEAKVSLVIEVGGELYNFTRGVNGAECSHSGGIVTGQNEVSKFATELLGVDADMAMKLMFAPQGDLRGALKAGPTAISTYIEDMSGMDLFERLLDLISEKLETGPTTRLDGEIAELEAKLERGGPAAPDTTEIDRLIDGQTQELRMAERLLPQAEKKQQEANDAFSRAKAAADVRETAVLNLRAAEASRDRRLQQKAADTAAASVTVDEARIPYLEKMLADATALQARKTAYSAFSKLPVPEMVWEGDEASLRAAIADAEASNKVLSSAVAELASEIKVREAQRTTASVCGFCQQDMSQFPEVAKKNAEIDAFVADARAKLEGRRASLAEKEADLAAMKAVMTSAAPFSRLLQTHGQYLRVDNNFVPPKVEWDGPIPEGDVDVSAMKAELSTLKECVTAKTAATIRLEQIEQALAENTETIERLKAAIGEEVDLDALYKAKFEADTQASDWVNAIRRAREGIQSLESNKSRLLADYRLAVRDFEGVAVTLQAKREERDRLQFNNTLIKKVKAARPVVASKLWSLVLSSVSTMFSSMRGEQSVVTKGPKGFLVNDRPAEALSGSALDLLGFSIRVAMLKTFIPDCSFMILDEATSACDDNRTASLLGFIASAGFPQTLLVTHEEASESVADNVVMI